jgi:hypothetical protein
MTGRGLSLLLTMAIALVVAAALLALSGQLDAPWLAVIAVLFVGLALVQRDRFLFQGAWGVALIGVAIAVAFGFVVEKLT